METQNKLKSEDHKTPVMHVNMFGGMAIDYCGHLLTFPRSASSKFMQLLALLLLNGQKGITKSELIGSLYSAEEGINLNRNLNNVIYRLKKQLVSAGLPEEEYIILENGRVYFSSSFLQEVDVVRFQEAVQSARTGTEEMRRDLLETALYLYSGEVLPEYAAELWAIQKRQECKNLYAEAVRQLGELLKKAGDVKSAREVYRRAAKLYPYDDWQVMELDCLIMMKEFNEAYVVYNETAKKYSEELGLPPGPELLDRLHTMERQMLHPVGSFSEIRKVLDQGESGGPYYCYYPSFLDSCQILARIAERSGLSIYLLLCTLTEKNGKEFTDGEKLEAQMEKLKQVIGKTFRKGDLFTRYSKSQFLVILNGTEMENSIQAFDRLLSRWKAEDGASGNINYSLESLLNLTGLGLKPPEKKVYWAKMENKWRN